MADSIEKIIERMMRNPINIDFADICKVCDFYFGKPRQDSTSHRIYKTPWQGDPRINIQAYNGKAKAYQVGQVLKAISRLEAQNGKSKKGKENKSD